MASDSSDDDVPLARSNGHRSAPKISKAQDRELDRRYSGGRAEDAGLSIRNGPVRQDAMEIDGPSVNGNSKRKSRSSISKVSYRDESGSDEAPLAKRQKSKHKAAAPNSDVVSPISKKTSAKLPPSYKETLIPDSPGDPNLGVKLAKKKASIEKKAEKEAQAIRAQEVKAKKSTPRRPVEDDSDDDMPLSRPKPSKRQSGGPSSVRKVNGARRVASDSDEPIASKRTKKPSATPKAKEVAPGKASKATSKAQSEDAEEDEGEEFEWWNAPKKEDDSIKWTTLEHKGVLFAPPYQRLPSNVKLLYDGIPVNLHIEAEEVAWFFGSMLHSTLNVENPVFQRNFFNDFKEFLKRTGGATDKHGNPVDIKEFAKLDFTKMHEYWNTQNEAKKARSKEEKKADKAEKDRVEAPFMYCKWDGRKEKVGNFRVEPPGLFRGRGEHPKTGKVKLRVMPEQVTINIGRDAEVPEPPPGHKWKAVQHDNKATWLAMWQENINGAYKYVMLSAQSAVKGQSDFKKFEKARELKKHIDRIRADYTKEMRSEVMADRQRATAMYLIDRLALRAGNEKDAENEAETVGCCSLKFEHVTLEEPNTVIFDFLGKDSIRFYDEVKVEKQVFKNLKLFKKPPKTRGDDIFDRLNTTQLNKHLSSYMPGLTAKVFRTYNASWTMSDLLQALKADDRPISEKVKLYNDCNRRVAILCNHKRTVGAGHEQQMEKLGDKIKGVKYKKWRTKQMILDLDPKQKKKRGAEWFGLDEDLTEDWILEHQTYLVEKERENITKKFQKDNEKRKEAGEKAFPDKELKERLKAADELQAKFKKENKTKKVAAEGRGPTVEKFEGHIEKFDQQIKNLEIQAEDREGNKEVALSTSKINYIDPRLTVVFSKKFNVPIEKFFSKTLREKFNWAIKSVEDEDWEF